MRYISLKYEICELSANGVMLRVVKLFLSAAFSIDGLMFWILFFVRYSLTDFLFLFTF
jgi:hypothetical protein